MVERPVVVRTYVHLVDRKGWKKDYEYPGDFGCGDRYRERRRFNYRDAVLPIGKFEQPDYPRAEEMRCTDYEYELQKEDYEIIHANYYFKHMYFLEM